MRSLSWKYRRSCSSPCLGERASEQRVHRGEKGERAIEGRGERSTDTDPFSSCCNEPGAGGAPSPRDRSTPSRAPTLPCSPAAQAACASAACSRSVPARSHPAAPKPHQREEDITSRPHTPCSPFRAYPTLGSFSDLEKVCWSIHLHGPYPACLRPPVRRVPCPAPLCPSVDSVARL